MQAPTLRIKMNAAEAFRYFRSSVEACNREYKCIEELSRQDSDTEPEEMSILKDRFKCVVSLDYQMTKLIPHWGRSAQPSASYYKMKLAVDICVAITHHDNQAHIIIFDETFGPKNSNHTLSFLTFLLQTRIPAWVKHVQIFMDNAAINKNRYLGGWLAEMVLETHFEEMRASFMDAGHTKFPPDWVMAKIAKSYAINDVFNLEKLGTLCKKYGEVTILPNDAYEFVIQNWREPIAAKYTDMPGIQKVHDFRATLHDKDDEEEGPESRVEVTLKVKDRCNSGVWRDSVQKVRMRIL